MSLCSWSELVERGSLRVSRCGQVLLIVRDGAFARAYLDQCPHNLASLDGGEGGQDFLTPERDALICRGHGALFRLRDGYCFAGPCAGRSLIPFAVERHGQIVDIALGQGNMLR